MEIIDKNELRTLRNGLKLNILEKSTNHSGTTISGQKCE